MRYEILAPAPVTGVFYGVAFTGGLAWVVAGEDDPAVRTLRANGFLVVDRDAPPEPELDDADDSQPSIEDTNTSDEERS